MLNLSDDKTKKIYNLEFEALSEKVFFLFLILKILLQLAESESRKDN